MSGTITKASNTETVRSKVGPLDLAWLTWRQHRLLIATTTLAVLAFAGYLVWTRIRLAGLAADAGCDISCPPRAMGGELGVAWRQAADMVDYPPAFGLLIAAFWAAPLLSREYEQRTHLIAWGQDATPLRWLAGKVAWLAAVTVGLALALGAAVGALSDRIAELPANAYSPYSRTAFEAFAPLQAAYALFGFALGLALSAVLRRTLPAMAASVALFVAARVAVYLVRPHFLAPLRQETTALRGTSTPDGALVVNSGYLTATGNEIGSFQGCHGLDFESCLRENGVASAFVEYQPIERLTALRMIEFAVFAVLAAGLFAVAWYRVRKEATA